MASTESTAPTLRRPGQLLAGTVVLLALAAAAWRHGLLSAGPAPSAPMPAAADATPEALAAIEAAIARAPDDARLHLQRGNLLYRLRRFPEAIAAYERVLAIDGRSAEAYKGLGLVHGKADEYAPAEAAFRRALELDPDMAVAHNGLGVVLLREGRRDEARAAFERALELDPTLQAARTNLETVTAPADDAAP